MPLSATTVKADPKKIRLAKLKGINVSRLFREALDTSLRVGDDRELLNVQLEEIRKNMEILQLEEKLVISQLKTMELIDAIEAFREAKYEQWKNTLAYQIQHKSIDWENQRKLFRFDNKKECENWIKDKLKKEGLIE